MDKFCAYAPAYLIKSGNKNEPYRVGGILSTEDRDIDGEILLKSMADYSYFTGGYGTIKYEHNLFKGPNAIIGFPTKLLKKGKETWFEGDLITFDPDLPEEKLTNQQRLAKSTVSLLKHMEEYNKVHPENQRKAGWSVEGETISKDNKTGLIKAVVTDVVFTTSPRNKNTFAQLLKSLEVGYGNNSGDQTGLGSTRKESLDNQIKFHTPKGEIQMKTKNDFYKECLAKGMSQADALKEAEKMHNEQKESFSSDLEKVEKSVPASKEALQKSIASAGEVLAITVATEIGEQKTKLAKSLKKIQDGESEDLGEFLTVVQNTAMKSLEVSDLLSQKIDKLAKSISSIAEAIEGNVDGSLYLAKSVGQTQLGLSSLRGEVVGLTAVLAKSVGIIPSEMIGNSEISNNGNEGGEAVKLNKGQVSAVLFDLYEKGKVSSKDVGKYEGAGVISEANMKLVKSVAKEVLHL